jgi:hypothetical protein
LRRIKILLPCSRTRGFGDGSVIARANLGHRLPERTASKFARPPFSTPQFQMTSKRQSDSDSTRPGASKEKYKKLFDTRARAQIGVVRFADQSSGKRYAVTGVVLKNEPSKFVAKARSLTVAILHGTAAPDTLDVVASREVPGFAFVLPTSKPKDDAPEVAQRSARGTELLAMAAPVAHMIGAGTLKVNAYPDGTSDPATSIVPGVVVQVNGVKVVQNDRDPYRFHVNAGAKLIHLSEPSGFAPLESIWRAAATEEKAWTAAAFWWSMVAGGFLRSARASDEDDDCAEQVEEQKHVFREMWRKLPGEFETRLGAKSAAVKALPGEWARDAAEMLAAMAARAGSVYAEELAMGAVQMLEPLPEARQGDDEVPCAAATLHVGRAVDSGVPSVLEPLFSGALADDPSAMSSVACGGIVSQVSTKGNLVKLAVNMFFVGDARKAAAEIDAGKTPLITHGESQVGVKLSAKTAAVQLGVKARAKLSMVMDELLPYADITMSAGVAYKEPGVAANLKSFFPQEVCINAIDGIAKVAVRVSEEFVVQYLNNGSKVFCKADDEASEEQLDFSSLATAPKFPLLSKDGYQAITEATCNLDKMRLPEAMAGRKYGVVFEGAAASVLENREIAQSAERGEAFLTQLARDQGTSVENFLVSKSVVYCYATRR